MFASIKNKFKSSYDLTRGFEAVERSIRQDSSSRDELADNLFWLAKKSFYVARYDSLRIAEESYFIAPSKKKLKWLGFRFGDIKIWASTGIC